MGRENLSIREWQVKFAAGEFEDKDFSTQVKAGWYDWFCSDGALANKTKKLGAAVKRLKDGGKVNLDTMYVFFKNNCPCYYPLYDDFRICDIETGDVLYTCTVDDGYSVEQTGMKWNVFGGPMRQFDEPIASFENVSKLAAWLNSPWEGEEKFIGREVTLVDDATEEGGELTDERAVEIVKEHVKYSGRIPCDEGEYEVKRIPCDDADSWGRYSAGGVRTVDPYEVCIYSWNGHNNIVYGYRYMQDMSEYVA